jgi:ParB-like nuclease domain
MPSTQNAVNNHEYRSVPITALAESATNPRKRFDPKSLEELAASFKTQGILAPLLVRELEESKYEVVAGARRLRAAKLAELEKLLAVAHYLIGHLSYSQVPALAKRHKVEAKKDSALAQELLAKQVGTYDESELCRVLLEISLLDSAYQRSTASRDDVLMDAAKRYRVDTEKLQKAVAEELAAKRDKKTKATAKPKGRKTAA